MRKTFGNGKCEFEKFEINSNVFNNRKGSKFSGYGPNTYIKFKLERNGYKQQVWTIYNLQIPATDFLSST